MAKILKDIPFPRFIVFLCIVAFAIPLVIYGRVGFWVRPIADDYCHSALVRNNEHLWQAIWQNYTTWSDRYSNLILVSVTDIGGIAGMAALPSLLMGLSVVGLAWLGVTLFRLFGWPGRIGEAIVLAEITVFMMFWQAPNLYQVLFWRGGAMGYLAPLVVLIFLLGVIFSQGQRIAAKRWQFIWTGVGVFLLAFYGGGMSETADALQIAILFLLLLWVWWLGKQVLGQKWPVLMTWLWVALLAALLSMLIMFLSPGNEQRLQGHQPNVWIFLQRLPLFPLQFLVDVIKTKPLPLLVNFLLPVFLVWLSGRNVSLTPRQYWAWMGGLVLALFLIVMASFAPSAYAQSYPVERARFPAHFAVAMALTAGGFLSGHFWAGRIFNPSMGRVLAGLAVLLLAFYPLRAARTIWQEYRPLQERALLWDQRDAHILVAQKMGQSQLDVFALPNLYGLKELDVSASHWVNRCAAKYYGLKSIRALPSLTP